MVSWKGASQRGHSLGPEQNTWTPWSFWKPTMQIGAAVPSVKLDMGHMLPQALWDGEIIGFVQVIFFWLRTTASHDGFQVLKSAVRGRAHCSLHKQNDPLLPTKWHVNDSGNRSCCHFRLQMPLLVFAWLVAAFLLFYPQLPTNPGFDRMSWK